MIGTITRHAAGMGDDTYRQMLTIGPVFVAVGLARTPDAGRPRPGSVRCETAFALDTNRVTTVTRGLSG